MKKISVKIIMLLALCLILIMPVSAAGGVKEVFKTDQSGCVINGDFESVLYGEKLYLPLNLGKAFVDDNEELYLGCSFEDSSVQLKYESVDICTYYSVDYILRADVYYVTGANATMYFVSDSHYSALSDFLSDTVSGDFSTESYYGDSMLIENSEIQQWLNPAAMNAVPAASLIGLESYPLYMSFEEAVLKECGMIYRAYGETSYTYWLVYYPEYDRTYFYADGSFALEEDITAQVYTLGNDELSDSLSKLYDAQPDDDLDWLMNESNTSISITVAVVVFGVVPLVLAVLSVFFLIRKPRQPYKICLKVLLGFSIILLACFATFCVIFLNADTPII